MNRDKILQKLQAINKECRDLDELYDFVSKNVDNPRVPEILAEMGY